MKPIIGRNTRTNNQAQIDQALSLSIKMIVKAKIRFKIKALIKNMFISKLECAKVNEKNSTI